MKRIIDYLFPNDWEDVEVIRIKSHSNYNGTEEGLARLVVIQKSNNTGRYRRQVVLVNNV